MKALITVTLFLLVAGAGCGLIRDYKDPEYRQALFEESNKAAEGLIPGMGVEANLMGIAALLFLGKKGYNSWKNSGKDELLGSTENPTIKRLKDEVAKLNGNTKAVGKSK